jgi:excisionase family DNA binding protein
MDLKGLTRYAAVSERTLREWIHRADNPLPAVRVENKILVRRSCFDRWLEAHALRSSESADIGSIVNEVVGSLRTRAH